MLLFVLRRAAALVATLAIASVLIFLVMEVIPGDPASYMLGIGATDETIAALRAELGLDKPRLERYFAWALGMLQGDFGVSYTYRVPVGELILERAAVSVPLALLALLLTAAIALPTGVLAASKRNRPADIAIMGATQLGIAVPNFWFAILLSLLFAVVLQWFSAGGFPGWDAGILPALKALVLPGVALALPQASILARVMRSALIDTLGEDYIRTARAKGLTSRRVLWAHAVRNALIP